MPHGATPSGVLLLDKPPGITSTRALATAKRALAASKAGHTGTLDPFATGLLPLAFGEATKFSRFLIDSTKAYEAALRLGEETATGDPESPAVRRSDHVPGLAEIDEVLCSFVGVQLQMPPMHSALHVGGKRLYEYAREGVEVARESRQVEIFELRRLALAGKELVISVICSKGTYVRVLAADIGNALRCGAYLTGLRRTAVGPFTLDQAVTLDLLAADGVERSRNRLLQPEALVSALRRYDATADEAVRFSHGQEIQVEGFEGGEAVAIYSDGGRFLGVAEGVPGHRLAPLRLMAERAEMA